MEIISCADARAAGLKRYFTGEPCVHGHTAARFVRSANCLECNKRSLRKARQEKPEQARAHKAKYRSDEAVRAAHNEYNAQYRRDHPDEFRAYRAKRRAAKLKRTVKWANDKLIRYEYGMAQLLTKLWGVDYEVDHIIPLQGKLVSGLHCEANLRVIPGILNRKKSNHFVARL